MHFHNFALNYKKKQTKKHQTRTKRSILMDEYSLRLFKLLKQPHKLIIAKAKAAVYNLLSISLSKRELDRISKVQIVIHERINDIRNSSLGA